MNKEHVKGGWEDIKGKAKEDFGHATGDEKTEMSGVTDQVGGKIRKGFGDLKDKVKEGVDHLLHRDSGSKR